jgi:very-short-patch-repair endonuclease
MIERSRLLRKKPTEAEKKLWGILRNRRFHGFKFHRQYCLFNYILDFVCFEKKLIIELDGNHHLAEVEYDLIRDNYFKGAGFTVLRFWNHEVFQEITKVLKIIHKNLL